MFLPENLQKYTACVQAVFYTVAAVLLHFLFERNNFSEPPAQPLSLSTKILQSLKLRQPLAN